MGVGAAPPSASRSDGGVLGGKAGVTDAGAAEPDPPAPHDEVCTMAAKSPASSRGDCAEGHGGASKAPNKMLPGSERSSSFSTCRRRPAVWHGARAWPRRGGKLATCPHNNRRK